MGRADFGRAEYSRCNAVAHPLQWWDECFKLAGRVPRDVLAEQTSRPALVDDAQDLVDKESIVIALALPSDFGVGLARVAASDAINEATPASSVEGGKVRPDRSRVE